VDGVGILGNGVQLGHRPALSPVVVGLQVAQSRLLHHRRLPASGHGSPQVAVGATCPVRIQLVVYPAFLCKEKMWENVKEKEATGHMKN
jgi:hypothetical protein